MVGLTHDAVTCSGESIFMREKCLGHYIVTGGDLADVAGVGVLLLCVCLLFLACLWQPLMSRSL